MHPIPMNPSVIRSLGAVAAPNPRAVREITLGANAAAPASLSGEEMTYGLHHGILPSAVARFPHRLASRPFRESAIEFFLRYSLDALDSLMDALRMIDAALALYPAHLPTEITGNGEPYIFAGNREEWGREPCVAWPHAVR